MKTFLFILSFTFLFSISNIYPASHLVTNDADDSYGIIDGTLRRAITLAKNGDTIFFADTINHIVIYRDIIVQNQKKLTIIGGSGSKKVTIDGNHRCGIFSLFNIDTFNINNLILINSA